MLSLYTHVRVETLVETTITVNITDVLAYKEQGKPVKKIVRKISILSVLGCFYKDLRFRHI